MPHSHQSRDHHHALGAPLLAKPAPLSFFRMALAARLGVAVLIAVGLWATVLLAIR